MRIKIESDVHEIVDRIKEIDDGYFIVFNTDKNCFEIHNNKQASTYCLSYPYACLDSSLLSLVCMSNIAYIDNIIDDIDKNNNNLEQKATERIKDIGDYKTREIYKFASCSSKEFDVEKSFNEVWR